MSFQNTFHIKPGYPDFVDLPWNIPLDRWQKECNCVVQIEKGLSRHPVEFVEYEGNIFAIKELNDPDLAKKEYENLKKIKKLNMPSVKAIGYAVVYNQESDGHPVSILITQYLDLSLPYRSLFIKPGMQRYRKRLMDAMACLLVRLHLAGVFWGDCSLSNVLFRREAGELGAYVVDLETTKIYETLSDGQREEDLEIMQENIYGDLCDLALEYRVLEGIELDKMVFSIIDRYRALWNEVNSEVLIGKDEKYKIHERIRILNQMGFSVDEVELIDSGEGDKLKLRTLVTDQSYHRHYLHNLTGVVAKDNESRQLLNEIRELRAELSRSKNTSMSMSMASFHWLNEIFYPCLDQLREKGVEGEDSSGLYCQIIEHKWLLSEKAGRDVGMEKTIDDYVDNIIKKRKNAGTIAEELELKE